MQCAGRCLASVHLQSRGPLPPARPAIYLGIPKDSGRRHKEFGYEFQRLQLAAIIGVDHSTYYRCQIYWLIFFLELYLSPMFLINS